MMKHPQRYTKAGASLLSAGLIFAGISGVSLATLDAQSAFAEGEAEASVAIKEAWVSNAGSDTAAGTSDAPFASLEKAIEFVGDNGKVHVIGSYVLQSGSDNVYKLTSTLQDSTVTLVGEPGADLVVRGNALELTRSLTLENMKLSFRTDGNNTPIVYANGFDLTLDGIDTTGNNGAKPQLVMGGTGHTHSERENGTSTLTVKGAQSSDFDSVLAYNPNNIRQAKYLNVILEGNVKLTNGVKGSPSADDASEVAVKTSSNFVRNFDGGHPRDNFRVTFNGANVADVSLTSISHLTLLTGSHISVADQPEDLSISNLELRTGTQLNLKDAESAQIANLKVVPADGGTAPELEIAAEDSVTVGTLTGSPLKVLVDVPINYNIDTAKPSLTVTNGSENVTEVATAGKPGVKFEKVEGGTTWKVAKDDAAAPDPTEEEGDNNPDGGAQGGTDTGAGGTVTPPTTDGDTGGSQGGSEGSTVTPPAQGGAQDGAGTGNAGDKQEGPGDVVPPTTGGDTGGAQEGTGNAGEANPPAQGGSDGGAQGGSEGSTVTPPAQDGAEGSATEGGAGNAGDKQDSASSGDTDKKPNTQGSGNASGNTGGSNSSDASLNTGISKPSVDLPQSGEKPGKQDGNGSGGVELQAPQEGESVVAPAEQNQTQGSMQDKQEQNSVAGKEAGILPQTSDEALSLTALIAACAALGTFAGFARRRNTKK